MALLSKCLTGKPAKPGKVALLRPAEMQTSSFINSAPPSALPTFQQTIALLEPGQVIHSEQPKGMQPLGPDVWQLQEF